MSCNDCFTIEVESQLSTDQDTEQKPIVYLHKVQLTSVPLQIWFQTKSSTAKLPDVHGVSKKLGPNIQPEKQDIRPIKGNKMAQGIPRIGQGRAGMRRRSLPLIKFSQQKCQEKFLRHQN